MMFLQCRVRYFGRTKSRKHLLFSKYVDFPLPGSRVVYAHASPVSRRDNDSQAGTPPTGSRGTAQHDMATCASEFVDPMSDVWGCYSSFVHGHLGHKPLLERPGGLSARTERGSCWPPSWGARQYQDGGKLPCLAQVATFQGGVICYDAYSGNSQYGSLDAARPMAILPVSLLMGS